MFRRVCLSLCFGGLALAAWPQLSLANNVQGAWSPVAPWPLIAVHSVMTPDGRLLTYGSDGTGRQTGYFIYDVWDPSAGLNGGHVTLPNLTGTDIFCGSQVVLPQSGDIFLAGGDNTVNGGSNNTPNNNTNIFNPGNNTLTRGNDLFRQRWYSSSIVMPNAEVYTQGGNGGQDRPEVRQSDGTFRLLTNVDTNAFSYDFPRNFVAPDGRVFGFASSGQMYYVTPAGTGAMTIVGQLPGTTGGGASSAVMFRPGRILQTGGPSNAAVVIDITGGGTPVVTPTDSMQRQRQLHNATVMADGRVLVTGGSEVWNQMTGVSYNAEIWDPNTGHWTVGASEVQARLYHSGAILMPDASVLIIGGGAPGPQNNLNAEMYYPPYLFDASAQRAARPTIDSAPSEIAIGQTFRINFGNAGTISRVTLVKMSSVTHSFNMEQRFIELTFNPSGSQLAIQAPTRAGIAPPGYYMLFVIDANGVPSIAQILRIGVAPNANPATTPALSNPGNQSSNLGTVVSLALQASDPNGDVLGFGASGLPLGLSINPYTGVISGTPAILGSYNVVVAASDGNNTATQSFLWNVTQAQVLSLNPTPPPAPILSGNSVTLTASSSGGVNVQYRWNFADGSPVTDWSASNTVTHSYSSPGVYFVTLSATDSGGANVSQTIAVRVHWPLTARAPAVSGSMAYENSANGRRVWVVNGDADSVSVIDATNNTRLGEIAVGARPRTLAIAPNGSVWVANKGSSSISVIDAAALSVVRTIALPRGIDPYGIAFAPGGSAAFVAAEATGNLYKLDSVTGNVIAVVATGANPRHVSISADGARVYVSRFVTGRLPGEATAAVQSVVGGLQYGGEVRVFDAASLAAVNLISLRYSSVPDAENAGSGVPNYLGAVSISPDGRSAWVPSKQDNIARGMLRNGQNLNFQNTLRAISSRIDLATGAEDVAARIDHDNAGIASAAAFDAQGIYLFVALETSRQIAVVNAHSKVELFRIDTGFAPQGLVVSPDGQRLYVNNFMSRSVGIYDISALTLYGRTQSVLLASLNTVATERLSAQVLRGKQLFYDARDPRLAKDAYVSCASCHNDGGQDGRVWDLTGFGEGLRNTISLRGRAASQGFLHWSANFDEVQDFEGQIRQLAAGTGLMDNATFNSGTRSQPLGERKSGLSSDLDALAAYVASLNSFGVSPNRASDGSFTAAAAAGREVFRRQDCAACHSGAAFTDSRDASTAHDVGTIKPSSGKRLGAALLGLDVPTLRDVWNTGPWLHDGSAGSLQEAVQAHGGISLSSTDLNNLAQYLVEIGSEESAAPAPLGAGLNGRYYNNRTLSGAAALSRVEAVNFNWGSSAPGAGVGADNFSVAWQGSVKATTSGGYRLQTKSDDGVRVWLNGQLIVNNWTDHAPITDTSATINLVAGTRYQIRMEYYEAGGGAVAQLLWRTPGSRSYVVIPTSALYDQ